jgi:serine/threonine-protein kinase
MADLRDQLKTPPPLQDLSGETVGRFHIQERLGAGGMGQVYAAEDTVLRRRVAVKRMAPQLQFAEADRSRFLKEAQRASALNHPNIAAVYDVIQHRGEILLIMEHVEGKMLRVRMWEPISLDEFYEIALQCADGLGAAHEQHIVHGDIKPENIMLTPGGRVKILDFGVAKRFSNGDPNEATQSMASVAGISGGTPAYMAPEVLLQRPCDGRADLFSLGLVFYEMLGGKQPFLTDSLAGTIASILHTDVPSLKTVNKKLPRPLVGVVDRLLVKDPAARYPSAAVLRTDLVNVRDGERPLFAAAPAGWRVPWARRSGVGPRKASWGRAVLLAIVLGIASLSLMSPIRSRVAGWFAPAEDHIAVLPFENVGSDATNDAVSAGLMDSLASRLTNLASGKQALWVVPASEVRRRKINDPTAALRELGATIAVEGSLQRNGQTVDMTVNLINTKNLRQIGSVSIEDRAGDFASLEDQAVTGVARLMHIDVSPDKLRTVGGVSGGAYEDYLKALGYTQRYDKAGNLDSAIAALNDAIKADPRFALGYAQLGEAYRLKYQLDKNTKWIDDALANCNKAVELDDGLPAVYVTLGKIHHGTGKYDLALQEYQRALQLDPRNADAQIGLARSYDSAGRSADAENAFRKAIALRPDFWDGYNELGNFLDDHQRYEESIAQFKHAIQITPDNAPLYLNLAAAYIDKGDSKSFSEAEKALRKSIALEPSYAAYANLGYLYIQEQKFAEATQAVEKALQLNDKDYLVWGNLARAYKGLNNKQKAEEARNREIALVEQAVQATPRDGVLQAVLAVLYAEKKLHEKAVARIQSALALSPEDANVLENVGEAYEDLGDRAEALKYIEMSLQKGYGLATLKSIPELQGLLSDPNFRPR